jgi:hypothetical protein
MSTNQLTEDVVSMPEDNNIEKTDEFSSQSLLSSFMRDSLKRMEQEK